MWGALARYSGPLGWIIRGHWGWCTLQCTVQETGRVTVYLQYCSGRTLDWVYSGVHIGCTLLYSGVVYGPEYTSWSADKRELYSTSTVEEWLVGVY